MRQDQFIDFQSEQERPLWHESRALFVAWLVILLFSACFSIWVLTIIAHALVTGEF